MSVVQPSDELPGEPVADEARGGPTVLRIMLGTQLRRLREASGITPDQAGYEIRGSRSKISRLEHGRVGFKERDVEDLLTLYGVADPQVRTGMLSLAQQANTPGWWAKYHDIIPDWLEPYLGLEMAASLIRNFELQFVHGLLQTEDYARAVTALAFGPRSADEVERRVRLRMQRQDVLRGPDPPRAWFVLDESGAAKRRMVKAPPAPACPPCWNGTTCRVMCGMLAASSRCFSWARMTCLPPIGRRSTDSSRTNQARGGSGPRSTSWRCMRSRTRRSTSPAERGPKPRAVTAWA